MTKTWVTSLIMIFALAACGQTEFSGSGGSNVGEKSLGSSSGLGGAEGTLSQGAIRCGSDRDDDDDANHDANDDCECRNDDEARLPQPTVEEFLALTEDNAAAAKQVMDNNRCYISQGGGHGIEICMAGDKSVISGLWPIEIKGDQICVPAAILIEGAELFAGATLGECN